MEDILTGLEDATANISYQSFICKCYFCRRENNFAIPPTNLMYKEAYEEVRKSYEDMGQYYMKKIQLLEIELRDEKQKNFKIKQAVEGK